MTIENESGEIIEAKWLRKHKAIRGSAALKYPPNEARCRFTCGISEHDVTTDRRGERFTKEHRCFLARGHTGYCEFSSECGQKFLNQHDVHTNERVNN